MFDELLNFIFRPILNNFGTFYFVIFISILVSLLSTILYKKLTNQKKIKEMRKEVSGLVSELKIHLGNQEITNRINKEIVNKNMKISTSSILPNLITIIPLFILFGWLNASLSFNPIYSDNPFTVNLYLHNGTEIYIPNISTSPEIGIIKQEVSKTGLMYQYTLIAPNGTYDIDWRIGKYNYNKKVLITNGSQEYLTPTEIINDNIVLAISVNQTENNPINIFGWKIPWFGEYIIFSIICSMLFRKLIDVY